MRTIYDAMQLLAARGLDRMNQEELEMLAGATDRAEVEARQLSAICEGIACLVSADAEGRISAGNFQTAESVFELLCYLSNQFDSIAGMICLGEEARHRVGELQRADTSA